MAVSPSPEFPETSCFRSSAQFSHLLNCPLPPAPSRAYPPPNAAVPAIRLGNLEWEENRTMRSWIHHTKGRHVRQARVGLGDLREEHISRQGFFGPVAMIYREHGPNEVVRVEGTLLPRRVADTARVEPSDMSDPRGTPEVLLSNADVCVAISRR